MATKGIAARRDLVAEAEVESYANADTFPELHMDDDTRREVKASWIMFVQQKGSVEEAENAICRQLQKADSPFAQLLYPDKGKSSRRGKSGDRGVDPETGQLRNTDSNRQNEALMRAGLDTTKSGGGGGCPFAGGGAGGGGGGGGRGMGGLGGGGGGGGLMSSLAAEDFDPKEFAEVMKKVKAATEAADKLKAAKDAAAKARGEESTPQGQKAAAPRAASRGKQPKDRGRSPAPHKPQTSTPSSAAAPTAERRAATPSGKSTATLRRVSL